MFNNEEEDKYLQTTEATLLFLEINGDLNLVTKDNFTVDIGKTIAPSLFRTSTSRLKNRKCFLVI